MVADLQSHHVFGFKITPITAPEILDLIDTTIANNETCLIASQNLHGIYMYFTDEAFRAVHERAYVHIDGMPVVWLGRLAGLEVRAEQRTGWIDWFMPLMRRAAEEGWRVFYLGAEPEVLDRGLRYVENRVPDIKLAGHHGYFDATPGSPENRGVVAAINAHVPQLLIVGMGMGRQERWILDNLDDLDVNCIGTAGACLEYFAGAVPTPPRWLGRWGLEWAYRLLSNPRRFWWRYLVEPWLTAWLLLSHQVRTRFNKD